MANEPNYWGDGMPFDLSDDELEMTSADVTEMATAIHLQAMKRKRRVTGVTISLAAFSQEASLALIEKAAELCKWSRTNPFIAPMHIKGIVPHGEEGSD
jgi:hypothetical protein